MKTKISFVLAIVFSILYASCKKYEEGPSMSLRSKKSRLANTWKVDAYLKNGVDMTADYRAGTASESYELTKDGKYTTTATYTAAFGGGTSTDSGTWEFINDKEDIKTVSSVNSNNIDTIHVTKLKNKELWQSFMISNDKYEIHMVPK